MEHLGDLAVGEAAEVSELDDLSLVGGQLRQRLADLARVIPALDLDVGLLRRREPLGDPLVRDCLPVPHDLPTERVNGPVVDGAQHP